MDDRRALGADSDPLSDDTPEAWDLLVQAIGPASVLFYLERRMSSPLRALVEPADLWQETLLHVWRDRAQMEWRGISAFRRWVLSVAENRIRNAVDRFNTLKRDGGTPVPTLPGHGGKEGDDGHHPPQVSSTTPSRVASYHEEAVLMRDALEGVSEELRDVVRLRLFEERTVDETAQELGLGISAVKHRFRKGAALYKAQLERLLAGND